MHMYLIQTTFSPLINLWTNSRSAPAYRNFWPEKLSFIGGGGGWIGSFFKNFHWFINYQPFNQQVVILYPQTFVRSACSSICLCAYLKLWPRPYVFFNMKTLYIRQNEDQGQSSNEWLLPKVMFSFIYVYSSLQQRYFDIFYLFRTPFSVSKYKCVQMDAT